MHEKKNLRILSENFADLPTPGKGKSAVRPMKKKIRGFYKEIVRFYFLCPDQTLFPSRELDTNLIGGPTPLSKRWTDEGKNNKLLNTRKNHCPVQKSSKYSLFRYYLLMVLAFLENFHFYSTN